MSDLKGTRRTTVQTKCLLRDEYFKKRRNVSHAEEMNILNITRLQAVLICRQDPKMLCFIIKVSKKQLNCNLLKFVVLPSKFA